MAELAGEEFALHPEGPAQWLLIELGNMAGEDEDSDSPEGARLIFDVVRSCLRDEAEFTRFRAHAVKHRISIDDIVEKFLNAAIEGATGRPTTLPNDSSDGQRTTNGNSRDASSSQATDLAAVRRVAAKYEAAGRPDLAAGVEDIASRRSA